MKLIQNIIHFPCISLWCPIISFCFPMKVIQTINIFDYENKEKSDNYIVFLSSSFCEPCKEILAKIEELNNDICVYKILIDTI